MQKRRVLDKQYNFYSSEFFKFYAIFLSVTVCYCDMQWNRVQIMCFPMYDTVFAFFALINKK